MKKALLMIAAVFSVAAAAATPASAWVQIAQRNVSDRYDVDVIGLPGNERWRQMMICVYRNPVRVYDIDIRFYNGGHQDFDVRSVIAPGTCTRPLSFRSGRRNLETVTLRYEETSSRRRSATVRVFVR